MIDLKMLREQAPHVGLIDEELIELLDYIDQLQQEVREQCRVNGMGSEREVALLSKVSALEKENITLQCDAARYRKVAKLKNVWGVLGDAYGLPSEEAGCGNLDESLDAMEASNAKAD